MRAADVPLAAFSAEVKGELALLWAPARCDRRAELAGLIRSAGTLEISSRRLSLRLVTQHGPVARKSLRLVRGEYALGTEVRVERRARLRKNLSFTVRLPPQPGLETLLREAGVLDAGGRIQNGVPAAVRDRDCCARAYLRGFFQGSGWVNHPDREHHLELTCPEPAVADELRQMLARLGLGARTGARKGQVVLYLKDSEQVARFLALVGAHRHVLLYEDVRAYKEIRGHINRQVNAETANLAKAVDAARRQVEAIRSLQAGGVLQRLPAPLRELAALRLRHPEASLKELGEMCHPPVGKSGVNHRMRQLLRWAEARPT